MNTFGFLNRVTYGPKPNEILALEKIGWEAWVSNQLTPNQNDPIIDALIKSMELKGTFYLNDREVKRNFRFERYFYSAQELWATIRNKDTPDQFYIQLPFRESICLTWLRAVHSQWQLKEMIVEFWHNHFNVSAEADDFIQLMFPIYDREVIRKHCFGNFRNLLEAVAKSPCMLYYLDNVYSKASPANENYARELFELHTLGAQHYFNDLYDEWRKVPGAWEEEAVGYIDEDVYEAARAFTGWTVANGEEFEGVTLPNTGEFYYYDQWHDHYQKRVLGKEFKSHRAPMEDGHKVLDLVAYHPGTAKHVCTKLCTWLVADQPPKRIVDEAVSTWIKYQHSEQQIAKTINVILLSDEFKDSLGSKIKRPNHLALSLIRQLGAKFKPDEVFFWGLQQMGFHQFTWALPTGHPDDANYWLTSDMMLKRWNAMPLLLFSEFDDNIDMVNFQLTEQMPDELNTLDAYIDFWYQKLNGKAIEQPTKEQLALIFKQELQGYPVHKFRAEYPKEFDYKLRQLVSMIAIAPSFQKR
ncbi:MAG: DUF1800 domain-containing protein [Flammeovirgaceae bacterium]